MEKKPLIGITCNYDHRSTVGTVSHMGTEGQDWNFVAGDYIYIVERAGGIPVLIPRYADFEDAKPLLDRLDGVVITGGHDVGPNTYGAFLKKYCGDVVPKRDEQDMAVVRYMACEKERPVLGICRGIQIMNVAFGGTLYQDLSIEGGFEHHMGDRYPRNLAWHQVRLEKDSIIERIFEKEKVDVNSFHHQGVKEPGKDVRITAYSDDGVPEVIEVSGHEFVVGVQWHPEMMYDSEEQLKLLKAFVKACVHGK